MAAHDGKITIDTTLNTDPLQKGIRGIKNQFTGLKSAINSLVKPLATVFAVGALVNFGKECVKFGSNVAEVQNVVNTAFGDMAYKVEDFAKTAIENFGMSQLAAKKTASTYMAMAKNMGVAGTTASDMAITLAGLTGDVASFFNISQELADIKLKSVFTGETETLKDLGIVMTQDNLAAYALKQGIEKSIDSMTQAEKVVLRYNFVLDNLSMVTGDFARTSDSWANQTRILSMQWQELMSIVGQSIITILTPLVKTLNAIVASLINVANTANSIIARLFGGTNTQLSVTQGNAEKIAGTIDESVENQDALTEATKETAKAQKGAIAGFDEINRLTEESAENESSSLEPSVSVDTSVNTEQVEESTDKVKGILDGIAEAIQPAADSIRNLWEVLQPIGTFAGEAFADFYENALKPIGTWVLGEGLPRFVDAIANGLALVNWQNINDSLHALWEKMTPFAGIVGGGLVWLWEKVLVPLGVWTMSEAVPLFIDGTAAALGLFNEVWANAQPALAWLWDNFLKPIAEWTGGVFVDVFGAVVDLMRDLTEVISGEKTLMDFFGDLTPLQTTLLSVGEGLMAVAIGMDAVAAVKGITNAFNAITTFVKNAQALKATGLFGKLAEVFLRTAGGAGSLSEAMSLVFGPGSIIAGIAGIIGGAVIAVTNFLSMLEGGFNWVKEMLMVVGIAITAVGAIILGAPALVAGVIAAIVAAVATAAVLIKEHWEEIKEAAKACWEAVVKKWEELTDFFADLWNGIRQKTEEFFDNIGEFAEGCWKAIKGVFSGVWGWVSTKVIQPIKNGFRNFVNGLIGNVETFVNGFVRGINRVIEAVNSLNFDVPDWVPGIGGKSFGFNMRRVTEISLPRLATGAVVPPNREFMAILGDNKRETEVVSPLSTMKQAVLEALQEAGGLGGGTVTVVVNLDGKEVARNQVKHINEMTRQAGKPVLLL